MGYFFLLLMLVSFLAIPVSLINPAIIFRNGKVGRLGAGLICFGLTFLFFVLAGSTLPQVKKPVDAIAEVQPTNQTAPTATVAPSATPTPIPYIQITASKLYAAYEENSVRADEQYKNKLVEVSGVSENISRDIVGTMYVTLKTDNLIGSVQCMLPSSEKQKAIDLKKGTLITVRGKCTGKLMNILINDCTIVQ